MGHSPALGLVILSYLLSIALYGEAQRNSQKECMWNGPQRYPFRNKGPTDLHTQMYFEGAQFSRVAGRTVWKKNQSFWVRETQFQISPLKLTPVMIWSKSFSTGSAITLPTTHPGGGVSSSPNDRRMQLAISGWGYRCQMSCKAQESPVQQRIVPPKMPTVSTPKNPIVFSVLNYQNSDKHTNLPGWGWHLNETMQVKVPSPGGSAQWALE